MRPAKVIARRQLADGRRLVQIVCPRCNGRHWITDTNIGTCPRRPGTFTIRTETTK